MASKKQQNKQVGRDKGVKTSPLFTPTGRRGVLKIHKGGKAAASGEGTEGAGLQLLQETPRNGFFGGTNHERGL